MEHKQRRIHRTDQEWVDLIFACQASSLDKKEWCAEHDISSRTFGSKVRELKRKGVDLSKSAREIQQVVPLPIIAEWPDLDALEIPTTNESPAVILRISDYSIEILNHAVRDTILNTLSALQQLC